MANSDISTLIEQVHLLTQRCATICKNNADDIRDLESSLTQAVSELARATDNWTKLATWAAAQGFDPSDYESSNEN